MRDVPTQEVLSGLLSIEPIVCLGYRSDSWTGQLLPVARKEQRIATGH